MEALAIEFLLHVTQPAAVTESVALTLLGGGVAECGMS